MQLQNRAALIHGGGGAIGGAVARALARQGARVFLAGRTMAKLEASAAAIGTAGGRAEIAAVDALDEPAVAAHAAAVAAEAGGRIDIALNAIGVMHVQGVPLAELALEDFFHPVAAYVRSTFITARAAARHMGPGGVIFTLTTPAGQMAGPGFMGHSAACAAVEAMSRHMAGELGAAGIRTLCLRAHAIPDTLALGSHANGVFAQVADRAGLGVDVMLAGAAQSTLLKRLPTLEQLAETAAFLASDHAGAMTGAVVNLTAGASLP
jgi:3-oxoacyl-[acyl-carrier protein] reductase